MQDHLSRDAASSGRSGGLKLQAILITHAHPDHFGSSHAICTKLGIQLWAGALDREAIESATPTMGPGRLSQLFGNLRLLRATQWTRY